MYNFAQALSAGYVKLIDWKSIENAQMATVGFKNELIKTALECGTLTKTADGMYKTLTTNIKGKTFNLPIDATHNFNDSLSYQWMTTEVLVKTLNRYSDATTDIGKKATYAATEVKTFTMMMDTLKEAAQSGWAYTWEYIFGDFNEAKAMWTEASKYFAGILDASANARNEMLKQWHDMGGREDFLQIFRNIAAGIESVVKPIKEAFREIFPKKTAQDLYNLTKRIREFTDKLKLSDENAKKLKDTFKGFFSIISAGINIIKQVVSAFGSLLGHFSGLGSGILTLTSHFGNYLSHLAETINKSEVFKNVLQGIVTAIDKVLTKLGELAKKYVSFEGIMNFFKGLFNLIKGIAAAIGKVLGELFRNGDMKTALDTLNTGIVGAGLFGIARFMNNLADASKNLKGFLGGAKDLLKDVGKILEAWQQSIKANVIMKIAKAIAVMAASLLILSMINPERLTSALTAMTASIAEMMTALWLFFKIFPKNAKQTAGMWKALTAMMSISFAMMMFAGTLKSLAELSWDEIGRGLAAMAGAIAELEIALFVLKKMNLPDLTKSISALNSLTWGLFLASVSLKLFATMEWPEIGRGLAAMGGALAELVIAMNFLPKVQDGTKIKGLFGIATSMIVLGGALKIMASMSWPEIARGLVAMGIALAELVIAMNFLPLKKWDINGMKGKLSGMFGMVTSMVVLAGALKILATMSWGDIARSLVVMGVALAELVGAMVIISKFVGKGTSGSMILLASSLVILAGGLKILASVNLGAALLGLVGLAAALAVLGVAAKLLTPLAPSLLAVAGAMALFSLAVVGFGAGLLLISAGIASLATALAGGATIIVAGISAIILGILQLIPDIMKGVAEIIKGLCIAIQECAPLIAETIVKTLYEVFKVLATYSPQLIEALAQFIIGVLQGLTKWVPQIIQNVFVLLDAIFTAIIDAIKVLDPTVMMQGVACIGMLTAIMLGLAALSHMIPAAAIGVLGFGALVAELAAVLAILGALSKIPGLKDLVGEGGNLLQAVGTAIGQFIGGILGGIALGVTSVLPEVADNLSMFMVNIQPFLAGVKQISPDILGKIALLSGAILLLGASSFVAQILELISIGGDLASLGKSMSDFMINMQPFLAIAPTIDPKILDGITTLSKAMLILSAANFVDSLTSVVGFFVGGHSLADFGKQIAELGNSLRQFADNLGNFDDQRVKTVECAGKAIVALAEAAQKIPNEGGLWSFLAGDNSIAKWGAELPGLGEHLKKFVNSLGTFSDAQVNTVQAAGDAILKLAGAAEKIPAKGGLWEALAGDNSLATFGKDLPDLAKNLNAFITNLGSFDDGKLRTVEAAGNAIVKLAEAAEKIPNEGGLWAKLAGDNSLATFSSYLPGLGSDLNSFITNLGTFDEPQIKTVQAVGDAIVKLAEAAQKIPNEGGLWAKIAGDNSLATFSGYLPKLGSDIASFLTNLGTFNEAQVATVTCVGDAIVKLAEAAQKIPNEGGLWAKIAGDNSLATFSGYLPKLGSDLASFLSNLGTFTDQQVSTVKAAGDAIVNLANAANTIPNEGGLWAKIFGDNSISTFADKLPGVGSNLKAFATNLGTFTQKSVDTVDCASKAVLAMSQSASQIPKSGGLAQLFSGDNDLGKFSEKFPAVATNLNKFMSNIGTFGTNQVETCRIAVEAMGILAGMSALDVKSTGKALEEFGACAISFSYKLKEFIASMSGVGSNTLADAIDKTTQLIAMAKQLGAENIIGLATFAVTLKTLANNGVRSFVDAFTSMDPQRQVAEGITNIINALLRAAEGKKWEVENKFNSIGWAGVNALSSWDMVNAAERAGANFVQGFARGIYNNQYLARNAGSSVGQAALNAAKSAIDAHSPSREAEKLGNFFDLGLVKGIMNFASKVYTSAHSVGEQAREGLSKAITRISDMVEGGMDTNPVIRPVLDLDGVSNGLNSMNSMFGSMTPALAGNLGAISNGMRGRNQNGNSDVVSAIDKLRNSLGNAKGDTYNIDGITYDDGSEIAEAVKTLVHAAKVERRR